MNDEQIKLIRQTFRKIPAEAFAESFYHHLFSIQPALRLLFPDDFGEQRKKLWLMLEAAVEMLDDEEKLVPVLEASGRRHALYGAREEHYETVGTALLAALREMDAAEFTAEAEEAWVMLYTEMSEIMKRGARRLADAPEQYLEKNTEENSMNILKHAKFMTGFFFIILMFTTAALGQTTAFTYQGKLNDGATAAIGNYLLEFKLFDTPAAGTGTQIGATLADVPATVTNGIFTVQLNFGANSFNGADRFLEISVRRNVNESYTTLAPRQPLTSTPYAIRSKTAETATNSAQLGGIDAADYVKTNDSRLTDSRNPLPGNGNYIQNTTDQQASSNFNISGEGRANVFSANQFNIGNSRALSFGFASLFVGLAAGEDDTGGFGNTFVGNGAGMNNTTGESNSFFGLNAGIGNTTGSSNTMIGANANVTANNLTYATALGAGSTVSSSNTIALGRSNGADTVLAFGRLQINTLGSAGSTSLCRNASNQIATCSSSLRYKTNINSFDSGLRIINRLRPITFDWKDGGMKDLGLGAEDVAEVDENLVIRNDKGEVEGVKYDRLGVVLINAVREQQSQIEAQRRLLESQARQIELLTRLVCSQNAAAEICRGEK